MLSPLVIAHKLVISLKGSSTTGRFAGCELKNWARAFPQFVPVSQLLLFPLVDPETFGLQVFL